MISSSGWKEGVWDIYIQPDSNYEYNYGDEIGRLGVRITYNGALPGLIGTKEFIFTIMCAW